MTPQELAARATDAPYETRIDPRTGQKHLEVFVRGAALRDDPILNKGTCFTREERDAFGLTGFLPPHVSEPSEQEARAYENYLKGADDVSRYLFLASLQGRNETLFYRLIRDHLEEMVPIIYTPTVGKVCERYSHIYRRPRGVYVSTADRGRIVEVLRNVAGVTPQIIVATDNEAILGIGDQGVGGMGIAIGKVALYTAGAGIHPAHGLPLDIDVGTDNQSLLEDPLYLGMRHPRLRGDAYYSLLDELVDAIKEVFPGALVQWEDFANETAFEVMRRYKRKLLSFDDDIQGTAAVIEAGIRTAVDRAGRKLADERIVFYGAGASGAGGALQLRNALKTAGVSEAECARRVLCLDSKGLILSNRPGLNGHKRDIAADPSVVAGWPAPAAGKFDLATVVSNFKPTVLVGVSGQPGSFTEHIVKTMAQGCAHPVILVLSNPTDKVEATPENILLWTNGAAMVGTGSPFAPVTVNGTTHEIGQGNNALVFPGVGLGATAVGAKWLPDSAFAAAAQAVYEATGRGAQNDSIFPSITRLVEISGKVAIAVGMALIEAGAAPRLSKQEVEDRIAASIWEPVYLPYRAAERR
jgi:malate dehydrogenase (oxaloacetate-decarboxylating)